MASNFEDLRAAVEVLQAAYDKARQEMAVIWDDPMIVKDPNGRYVLLDALTALVNARSSLANAERN